VNIKFPNYIIKIISRLNEAGYDAYAVGGCVRDSFLERTPHDWDVTTSAVPDEVMKAFRCDGFTVLESAGVRHGTVMVKCEGEVCEITTFRNDGIYSDHRRPDSVTFSDRIEDDLARRDFTMNAIAARPSDNGTEIVDHFGGEGDIRLGIIRTVGDPERRFTEDALRILRFVRFSSELGFSGDPDSASAAMSLCDTVSFVSAERITGEIWRMVCGAHFDTLSEDLLPLISSVFPCGVTDISFNQAKNAQNPFVRLSILLGRSEYGDIFFRKMRFSTKDRATVMKLTEIKGCPATVGDVCRLMELFDDVSVPTEYIQVMFGRDISPIIENIREREVPVKVSMLAVGGGDLSRVGIPPKKIGDTLKFLLTAVHEGVVSNERNALLEYAKRQI